MIKDDELEIRRLCTALETISHGFDLKLDQREALMKAGLAISFSFMHGLRPKIEEIYNLPLTEAEKARLQRLTIAAEMEKKSAEVLAPTSPVATPPAAQGSRSSA